MKQRIMQIYSVNITTLNPYTMKITLKKNIYSVNRQT